MKKNRRLAAGLTKSERAATINSFVLTDDDDPVAPDWLPPSQRRVTVEPVKVGTADAVGVVAIFAALKNTKPRGREITPADGPPASDFRPDAGVEITSTETARHLAAGE